MSNATNDPFFHPLKEKKKKLPKMTSTNFYQANKWEKILQKRCPLDYIYSFAILYFKNCKALSIQIFTHYTTSTFGKISKILLRTRKNPAYLLSGCFIKVSYKTTTYPRQPFLSGPKSGCFITRKVIETVVTIKAKKLLETLSGYLEII